MQLVVAYLMKTEGLSRDAALASVKSKRACAEPNAGFMTQLQHWGAMGCQIKVGKQSGLGCANSVSHTHTHTHTHTCKMSCNH